jgi:hypothetical protein
LERLQRNGHRAVILAAPQRFAGTLLAGVGEGVAHNIEILFRRAANFDQRFFLGEGEKLFDDAARELELFGDLGNGLQGRDIHRPQQAIQQQIGFEACVIRFWGWGRLLKNDFEIGPADIARATRLSPIRPAIFADAGLF